MEVRRERRSAGKMSMSSGTHPSTSSGRTGWLTSAWTKIQPVLATLAVTAMLTFAAACSSNDSDELDRLVAENFLRNSPTFRFDGVQDSIELQDSARGGCDSCSEFTFTFDSSYPGYGDRTTLVLNAAGTPHEATVAIDDGIVTFARLDDVWDVLAQRPVTQAATAPDTPDDQVLVGLDAPFELHVGQAAIVGSASLKITLVDVSEDSRCPVATNCITSGRARVHIDVLDGERRLGVHEFILEQRTVGGAEKGIGQYVVTMRELNPYPGTDNAPYAAIFVVTKVVAA